MTIARLECAHYRIPLPVVPSNSTHGAHDITAHLLAAVPNQSYLEVHGHGLDFDRKGLEALRA